MHIETDDVFRDMKEYSHLLDLSNYPKNHTLYNERNKKRLGFLKDECEGRIISEFVGLKPKLYSIKYDNGDIIKRCKGLQNIIVENYIKHEDYIDVLQNEKYIVAQNRRIESKKLELRTIEIKKISHTCLCDKRFILDNKIDTLPYGHYSL